MQFAAFLAYASGYSSCRPTPKLKVDEALGFFFVGAVVIMLRLYRYRVPELG